MQDAVIVGGGVVGASLALALAQTHKKIVLLEKNPEKEKVFDNCQARTIALSWASAHIYTALGVWPLLQRCAVPIKEVLVNVQGEVGRSHLRAREQGLLALGYVVSAQQLEKALYEACAKMPSIVIHHGVGAITKKQDPTGWEITVAADNTLYHYRSRLLVAADGAGSPLRQEQGIGCSQKNYGHASVLANVRRKTANPHVALERFLPFGAIALIPWQEDLATLIWTTSDIDAHRLSTLDDSAFMQACQQTLGSAAGTLSWVGRRNTLSLGMQNAIYQTGARFLLMGNAAHSVHPIAAQGLNLSLRDIWQLRRQLLRKPLDTDIGSALFLAEYVRARRADQSRVIFATDAIAHTMLGPLLPARLRGWGIGAFEALTPLKKIFTRLSSIGSL